MWFFSKNLQLCRGYSKIIFKRAGDKVILQLQQPRSTRRTHEEAIPRRWAWANGTSSYKTLTVGTGLVTPIVIGPETHINNVQYINRRTEKSDLQMTVRIYNAGSLIHCTRNTADLFAFQFVFTNHKIRLGEDVRVIIFRWFPSAALLTDFSITICFSSLEIEFLKDVNTC